MTELQKQRREQQRRILAQRAAEGRRRNVNRCLDSWAQLRRDRDDRRKG